MDGSDPSDSVRRQQLDERLEELEDLNRSRVVEPLLSSVH